MGYIDYTILEESAMHDSYNSMQALVKYGIIITNYAVYKLCFVVVFVTIKASL